MAPADVLQEEEEDQEDRLSNASDSSWSSYGLRWLFDPNRHDDLPVEQQLKYYMQRDLRMGKIYKIAKEIWKFPVKRKRVHFAPPMFNREDGPSFKGVPSVTSVGQKEEVSIPPSEPITEAEITAKEYRKEFDEYKDWIAQRKKFRNDLDNIGVSEEWLSRKPDKTPLEKRLLQKMVTARTPAVIPPPKVEVPSLKPITTKYLPELHRPAPKAIQILEKFLQKKKMRLVDLFASVDKYKSWKISRAAFRTAVQEAGIPMTDIMLEDLVLALDTDLNDELDYRELARGMSLWKVEKRENKAFGIYDHSATSAPLAPAALVVEAGSADGERSGDSRSKSAASTTSTTSTRFLTPPPLDTRPDARAFSSAEARVDHRKIERHILKQQRSESPQSSKGKAKCKDACGRKRLIKTGNVAVDKHSQPCTLSGETAGQVDKFRQLKLKEYYAVVNLCKENNVRLTEKLLEKVLLHPPDKPHAVLKKNIRQPGQLIDSRQLTEMENRVSVPKTKGLSKENCGPDRLIVHGISDGKDGGNGGRTGDDQGGPDTLDRLTEADGSAASKELEREQKLKRIYPPLADVAPSNVKMYLSTGKASIHRQVDCWMSFEEYDSLTRHLTHKYNQLHGPTDDNAFWPGHLLDKMQLHFPDRQDKKSATFKIINREKPIYPLLGHKPVLAYS